MSNRNYLTGDPLAYFENRVRVMGVWCDTKVSDKYRHFFVAKNPNSMLAISLCGQAIVRIEKLHENVLSQKCLVCELFGARGEEANKGLISQLASVIETKEQSKTESET